MTNRPSSRKRKHLYNDLLDRDGPWCHYCRVLFESGIKKRQMTIDHVVPVCDGGSDSLHNLVLACNRCNNLKGDLSYDEYITHPYVAERRATVIGQAMAHHHEAILFTRDGNWSCLCGAYGTHRDDPKNVWCSLMRYGSFYRPAA